MKRKDIYVDLDGQEISLVHLDAEERKLLARILRSARTKPDWDAFDNWWTAAVAAFYQARRFPRKAVPRTIPWTIAQDQSSRLAVAAGLARLGDCRDELEELIREKYPARKAFCEAAGLSEDMLSHVLAGRKDLSLASLTAALERIGYRLPIVPGSDTVMVGARKRKRMG
jgi:hypothetical protein